MRRGEWSEGRRRRPHAGAFFSVLFWQGVSGKRRLCLPEQRRCKEKWCQHLTMAEHPGIVGGCRRNGDDFELIENRCGNDDVRGLPVDPMPGVASGKVLTQTK